MAAPATGPACFRCRAPLPPRDRAGRGETCPACGAEVRVCRNCAFYAPSAYNDCREPNAERVVDKERANFCEFFHLGVAEQGGAVGRAGGARAALDALFRKQ